MDATIYQHLQVYKMKAVVITYTLGGLDAEARRGRFLYIYIFVMYELCCKCANVECRVKELWENDSGPDQWHVHVAVSFLLLHFLQGSVFACAVHLWGVSIKKHCGFMLTEKPIMNYFTWGSWPTFVETCTHISFSVSSVYYCPSLITHGSCSPRHLLLFSIT